MARNDVRHPPPAPPPFFLTKDLSYRIGVFRDDVVFLVYMYQRWAYRWVHPRALHLRAAAAHALPRRCVAE